MKKLLLLMVAFGGAIACSAQDTIKARNGAHIKAKVLEITPEIIRYQASGNPAAPVLMARKEEIVWIRFRNGTYEYLNPDPLPDREPAIRVVEVSNHK